MLKAIKADTGKYSVNEEKIWQIEKMLFAVKGKLLDGRIFQNCIDQEFDVVGMVNVTQNDKFQREFMNNIKTLYASFSSKIGKIYYYLF